MITDYYIKIYAVISFFRGFPYFRCVIFGRSTDCMQPTRACTMKFTQFSDNKLLKMYSVSQKYKIQKNINIYRLKIAMTSYFTC